MIADGMTIKLGDFGLAEKITDEKPRHYDLIGTAEYMAPEIMIKAPNEQIAQYN